tara:strand:+ start:347 stop:523 length:177 start_codon:yes stop_codon:yes gene_type:complete
LQVIPNPLSDANILADACADALEERQPLPPHAFLELKYRFVIFSHNFRADDNCNSFLK